VSARNVAAPLKRRGGGWKIAALLILDEAKRKVQPPIIGVRLNTAFDEGDSLVRLAGTLRCGCS